MTDRELLEMLVAKVTGMDERLDKMDGRFDKMDERLDKMDGRFDKMDERLDKMDGRFDKIDGRLDKIDDRFEQVGNEVTDTRLYLENVTDKSISILSESYSNLVDKLNTNIAITDKQFAYQIKVNFLAEKVDKIEKELDELKKNKTA